MSGMVRRCPSTPPLLYRTSQTTKERNPMSLTQYEAESPSVQLARMQADLNRIILTLRQLTPNR